MVCSVVLVTIIIFLVSRVAFCVVLCCASVVQRRIGEGKMSVKVQIQLIRGGMNGLYSLLVCSKLPLLLMWPLWYT